MANVYIQGVSGGETTTPTGEEGIELDDGSTSTWIKIKNLIGRKLRETGGTTLSMGAITDGQFLKRSGTDIISASIYVPRVTTITSSATPTINTDNCDAVTITALAAAITSMTTNLSGTPTDFQKLLFRIKDNGTARAITWGASFEAKGVTLPTTTVISKVLTVGFIWDSVTSKWGCIAATQEA